jgi:CheY-like chemotaxis protein
LEGVDVVSVRDWEGALRELAENPCQGLLVNDISVSGALENVDSRTIPYDIPVMICSVPGVSQAAGALGVSDYLVKPVSREDLLSALETLDLDGRTVLFVDDESDTLRLFRRMLVSSGQAYRVLRATDGQMALHMMIEHRPDVIFLDLAMPNMDGFQFLDLKSQEPACADIPVVVISARDPAGQPIVSNALTVTCQGGLSVQRLLNCIAALSEVLAPAV